jgi:predicted dehydrogenase
MDESEVSRRDFLKRAAGVAAVAALPIAAEPAGAPAILAASSPNSVVNYGFIGTGTEGCTLLGHLSRIPTGRCVATCDIYPPNLKKGVETIGSNPRTYTDYRQLLDQKDIDAVLIATPLNLHTQMTLDALSAGKHVFIEKCLFFKEEEEKPVREAVAAHSKQIFQVGLQRRSSVLYNLAIEMIRKGAIGKPTFVRAQWHSHTTWRRPVPNPKYERLINWRMYKEYSGGPMAELCSHQIDVANWAIGADPVAVVGMGGIDYYKDGRETYDNVEAIFEYPGGTKLLISSILTNSHYAYTEQIMGDRGTIEITIGKGMYYRENVPVVSTAPAKENWWAGATVTTTAAQQGIPIFPETPQQANEGFWDKEMRYARHWLAAHGIYSYEEPNDPWFTELVNYMACICDGKPIPADLEAGVSDALGVIYANRAIETGQKVFWPKKA